MKGDNQTDALTLLRAMSLPRGQRISVTYFGGASANSEIADRCLEDIAPSDPVNRQSDVPPFPELGGTTEKTAIGTGLESILRVVGDEANLVLITDGQEECGADFVEIRKRYPNANITVRQVGPAPNPALQLLEIKPQADRPKATTPAPATAFAWPPFQVTVRPFYQVEPVDHWAEAGWLEKYLWLIAYIFAAGSAACLGLSYIKMSAKVESSTRQLEHDRQRNAELKSGDGVEPKWPAVLTLQDIVEKGRIDRIRSVSLFLVALILGLPLALLSGVQRPLVVMLVAIPSLVLVWRLSFGKQRQISSRWNDQEATIETVREPLFPEEVWKRRWLALGLLLASAAVLLPDLDAARSAAWLVLSSNFSGLLSIAASAPLLFLGARWWSYKQASFRYYAAVTDAISEEIRNQHAAVRKTAVEWDNLKAQFLNWNFPVPIFSIRWWSGWMHSVAKTNRDNVINRLRKIVMDAGGEKPSSEANQLYRELLATGGLEGLVRTVVEKQLVDDEWPDWIGLADALKSGKDRKIAAAFEKLAS